LPTEAFFAAPWVGLGLIVILLAAGKRNRQSDPMATLNAQ
jgi:hypothetical protein